MGYVGVPPQSGFITTAKQRVTGSTNNYVDLDHSISSLADVIVWVNSVKQDSTNLILTTSTRITLGGTLVSSDVCEISFLGKAVATQTPDTGTVTNDMLAGSIANSKLANSSITLNGSAVSLGGSATVGSDFGTSYFAANRTTDFTVTDQTFVKLPIDNEIVDVGNNYDTSNYRYTAPATGYYYFYARGHIDAETDGELNNVEFLLKKNNSSYVADTLIDFQNTLGRKGGTTLTATLSLSANDYIEWWVYAKDNAGNPTFKSNASSVAGGGNQFGGWRIA